MIGSRVAAALLVLIGVIHLGSLVALSLTRNTRPLMAGDIAVIAGAGILYLVAAGGVRAQRRWGRWLGLAVSGVEAIPAAVLLYTMVVFSADSADSGSLAQFAFMMVLPAPLIVLVVLWAYRPSTPVQ